MIKVLQISTCDYFRGIEKFEFEVLKNINKNIKIDFLTPNNNTFKDHKEEIIKNNGKLYDFNLKRNTFKNKILYAYKLYKFLKKNKYDVIHINSSAFFFSFHVVLIAKICKIKRIIVHSHSVRNINKFKRTIISILNPIFIKMIDECLSCSTQACSSLYNKKYLNKIKIINNGIDIDKYKFNKEYRNKCLKKYNLENKTIYGHIGSFDERKNQTFLIDIFNEIQKKEENSVLILVGEGKLKPIIEEKVKELNLSNKVLFLGFIDNVNEILNCMDIFIFPSIMEGLGISVIEAQTNGLITYCSNSISESANISPNFRYFNLNDSPKEIAKTILKEKINLDERKNSYKYTIKNKYDIKDTCKELEKIYKGNY